MNIYVKIPKNNCIDTVNVLSSNNITNFEIKQDPMDFVVDDLIEKCNEYDCLKPLFTNGNKDVIEKTIRDVATVNTDDVLLELLNLQENTEKGTAREYTEDEVTYEFLNGVHDCIDYWIGINDTEREKMEGLAFSMLTMIDGCQANMPKFILAPNPHSEDEEYCIKEGINYYPQNHMNYVECDISGGLHELFYSVKEERGNK